MQFKSHIKQYIQIIQKAFLPMLGIAIFGFGIASVVAQSSQQPVLGFAWNGNTPTATHLGCLDLTTVQSPNPGQISTTQSGNISSGQVNPNQIPNSGQIVTTQGTLSPNSTQTNPQPVFSGIPGCGLGWIGMNSQTPGYTGINSFGVNLDMTSGALSGFAFAGSAPDPSNPGNNWENTSIGWVSFNPSSVVGCPDVPANCAPRVDLSSGKVTGWARVCSVFISGCVPSGSGNIRPSIQTGGWDGWIKLSDDTHGYPSPDFTSNGGVTYSAVSGDYCGYAWGGPVGGWIDFGSGPNCQTPPVDICQNITGIQITVPSGLILSGNDCIVDPIVVTDGGGGGGGGSSKLTLQASPQTDSTAPYETTLTWYSPTQTNYTSCQVISSIPSATNWVANTQLLGLSAANNWTESRSNIGIPTPVGSSTFYTIACVVGNTTDIASTSAQRGSLPSGTAVSGPSCMQTTSSNQVVSISWSATNVIGSTCSFDSSVNISNWDTQSVSGDTDSGSVSIDFTQAPISSQPGTYIFTLDCVKDIYGNNPPASSWSVNYISGQCSTTNGTPRPRFEEN